MQLQLKNSPSPRPRWPLMVASALFVAGVALALFLFLRDREQDPPVIVREDPVANLLGWIPATDENKASFAVWTPERGANPNGRPIATTAESAKPLALEPSPWKLNSPALKPGVYAISESHITGWATAGTDNQIVVMQGTFLRSIFGSLDNRSSYRGATIYPTSVDQGIEVATAVLENTVIIADSVDQVKAVIDAAVGKRESLAEDESITSLLNTFAPSNALMVVDAAKQAVECAEGDESKVDPSGQLVAVSYGRIGEGGEPRTLVATSFETEDEAAAAEAAYELGWRDGYVLAGDSGAPISIFARVNFVSQSGNLLIAELVEGRDNGWTRAAIRFATPVCEAVGGALPDDVVVVTEPPVEPANLNEALASLPDPGQDGVTLAADLAAASNAAGEAAPEDEDIRAEDIEAWLAKLGPLPAFAAFPTDGTKLARWPETFGISLGSISAISEMHGSGDEQSAAVLIGAWNPEVVEDHLSDLGFARTNWGDATIYTFGGDLDDPGHKLNRAAGAIWSNVGILGDRIYVSPSGRTLREVLDVATGDQSAATDDAIDFRPLMLEGRSGVTMIEIVGGAFLQHKCVDQGVTGIAPDWTIAAAMWSSDSAGGSGEIMIVPGDGAITDQVRQRFERQIVRDRTIVSADGNSSTGPMTDLFAYQELELGELFGGLTTVTAKFGPIAGQPTSSFFVESIEGCRFSGA